MTMRRSIQLLSALLILGVGANFASAAESKAVQSMATILINLHHFPSDADKQTLQQIVSDKATTADERTVAQALANVQHVVAAGDKAGLEAVVADGKANGSVKTLAGVILGLHHMPSDADKAKLQALTQ
jgi:hypothetical protein